MTWGWICLLVHTEEQHFPSPTEARYEEKCRLDGPNVNIQHVHLKTNTNSSYRNNTSGEERKKNGMYLLLAIVCNVY